jgi:hypothetical protein
MAAASLTRSISNSYRPMAIKTPAAMARTAITRFNPWKLKLISGMIPVRMSHTASSINPMLLFIARSFSGLGDD